MKVFLYKAGGFLAWKKPLLMCKSKGLSFNKNTRALEYDAYVLINEILFSCFAELLECFFIAVYDVLNRSSIFNFCPDPAVACQFIEWTCWQELKILRIEIVYGFNDWKTRFNGFKLISVCHIELHTVAKRSLMFRKRRCEGCCPKCNARQMEAV